MFESWVVCVGFKSESQSSFVLALTAVQFLTMGTSNWMAVRDAPAFWILSICVLWIEIQCFIPLQFLLDGEFNRLVLECVRRMQAFGLLLH